MRVDASAESGFVSLDRLAFTYHFDEPELQLRLTANPDRFQRQVLPVRSGAPADLIRARNSSAFLNDAAFVDTDAGHGHHATTIATDAGISVRGALIRVGAGRDTTGRFFRSPMHLTVDDETHLVRWDIGDTVAPRRPVDPDAPDPRRDRVERVRHRSIFRALGQLVHRERLAPVFSP